MVCLPFGRRGKGRECSLVLSDLMTTHMSYTRSATTRGICKAVTIPVSTRSFSAQFFLTIIINIFSLLSKSNRQLLVSVR